MTTLDAYFATYEKIVKVFPNTPENRGKRKWTNCPHCGGRIDMGRNTRNGHLVARCRTKGCFAVME